MTPQLTTDDLSKIFRAITFSATKHREQRRKDGGTPYINHPLEVADVLITIGGIANPDVLVAGILHDTVEDTDTSLDEIEIVFGDHVRQIVEAVTDDKSLDPAARKQLQIDTAAEKPLAARLVKMADKICNVRDITATSPVGWSAQRKREYVLWATQVVQQCDSLGITPLRAHFLQLIPRALAGAGATKDIPETP